MSSKVPPPPKPSRVKRRPGGYRIREDLDDSLRYYQEQYPGIGRVDIYDAALEEYLGRRKVWPLPAESDDRGV